jgi:hypothetical protein
MIVDQQRGAVVVAVGRVAAKVNLADMLDGEGVDVGARIEMMIDGADVDIVAVEQQATARAPRQLAQEVHLRHLVGRESDVSRRVLDENASPERFLQLIDVARNMRQRRLVVRQRQQVV